MDTFNNFPDLHSDNPRAAEYTEWDNTRLEALATKYNTFLGHAHLMPRAQAAAERIVSHVTFELECRVDEYISNTAESETAVATGALEVASADA